MSDAISAHLVVDDPERAAQWYTSAFGARETGQRTSSKSTSIRR